MDLILDVIQCEQISLTVDGAPPPSRSSELQLKALMERAGLELIEYSMFQLIPHTFMDWRSGNLEIQRRTQIQVYSRKGIHAKARASRLQ